MLSLHVNENKMLGENNFTKENSDVGCMEVFILNRHCSDSLWVKVKLPPCLIKYHITMMYPVLN